MTFYWERFETNPENWGGLFSVSHPKSVVHTLNASLDRANAQRYGDKHLRENPSDRMLPSTYLITLLETVNGNRHSKAALALLGSYLFALKIADAKEKDELEEFGGSQLAIQIMGELVADLNSGGCLRELQLQQWLINTIGFDFSIPGISKLAVGNDKSLSDLTEMLFTSDFNPYDILNYSAWFRALELAQLENEGRFAGVSSWTAWKRKRFVIGLTATRAYGQNPTGLKQLFAEVDTKYCEGEKLIGRNRGLRQASVHRAVGHGEGALAVTDPEDFPIALDELEKIVQEWLQLSWAEKNAQAEAYFAKIWGFLITIQLGYDRNKRIGYLVAEKILYPYLDRLPLAFLPGHRIDFEMLFSDRHASGLFPTSQALDAFSTKLRENGKWVKKVEFQDRILESGF